MATQPTVNDYLAAAPRVAALLRRPGVIYVGAAVVQSPGAWTRVGPTWLVPGIGWVTIGAGARDWGTKSGLAELATANTAKPTWHAEGISVSPTPNEVFAGTPDALGSGPMSRIAELTAQADAIWK